MMDDVAIGRVVHYVLPEDPRQPAGQHRAAFVVGGDVVEGNVTLHVFLDLERDGLRVEANPTGCIQLRRIPFGGDEEAVPGTWHWPEREGALPLHVDQEEQDQDDEEEPSG